MDLRESFLAALPGGERSVWGEHAELATWLAEAVADSHARHGGWPVEPAAFAAYLASRRPQPDCSHPADLALAAACQQGDAAALTAFDAAYTGDIDRAIARSPKLGTTRDEFRQLVRERLFVGPKPRIASYAGAGSLRGWLRVMTARLVIDLARRHDPHTRTDDELAKRIGTTGDHELGILREAYGATLSPAFEAALAALTVRQRNLLRQRYLHELTAERLAQLYRVHRSTIFDWLDRARAALLDNVREQLAERVGHDVDSVVALLGSDLHLSVRRMLDSRLEADDE